MTWTPQIPGLVGTRMSPFWILLHCTLNLAEQGIVIGLVCGGQRVFVGLLP